ncbi:MAG: penicillin-binding protein 2 [Pseudomonadota bacterium]|nr:penicillin-binding protein 2 [Pseudomonadota bacterium]
MEPREAERRQGGRFTRRMLLLAGVQAGLFGVLGWRLRQLQVIDSRKYALLSDENRISLQLLAPTRGLIVDRFGELIAGNVESRRVLVVPELTKDLDGLLDRIGKIVEIPEAVRARVIRLAKKQSPHIPIVVAEKLSWREFAQVNIMAPDLAGAKTDILPVRTYFHGTDIAHIVGYVGAADKNEVNDDPVVRLPGFRIGKSGVEKGFEKELRGRAGNVRLEVNAHGRAVRKLDQVESARGRELVLTIDHDIQSKVMKRLAEERRAAAVALDCVTGEVIAMASTPSYDPNALISGLSPDEWSGMATADDDPLTNKAIRGQYPPGSTFKMVTALAGLEAGVIDKDSFIACHGGYMVKNVHFGCWRRGGHGRMNVHNAIKQSCDVFFYETANRVGIVKLAAMARRLGFGQTYDFGLPLQKPGVVPDPGWKRSTIGEPWYPGETVIAGIGQGFVLTTPLQLAVMTARIATGRAVVPRIVRPDPDHTPAPAKPLGLKDEHLAWVRDGMKGVVNEPGGTAGRARLPMPDVLMAGKTGTSQVNTASSGRRSHQIEWHERDHGLFVCYAPADKPRYAVAVIVEHGGSGSAAASPVARDIMIELVQKDPVGKPGYVASDTRRKTADGDDPGPATGKGG